MLGRLASARRPPYTARVSDLWYFAYGSNLSRAVFCERRGMCPTDTRPARLLDHRLAFDIPVGPGERGVANVVPARGWQTWGVAYRLTAEECERLDRTEGVPVIYRRATVRVVTPGNETLDAFTYRSRISAPGRKPSPRYLGLLLDGAREHRLPDAWIRWLERLELAHDERIGSARPPKGGTSR